MKERMDLFRAMLQAGKAASSGWANPPQEHELSNLFDDVSEVSYRQFERDMLTAKSTAKSDMNELLGALGIPTHDATGAPYSLAERHRMAIVNVAAYRTMAQFEQATQQYQPFELADPDATAPMNPLSFMMNDTIVQPPTVKSLPTQSTGYVEPNPTSAVGFIPPIPDDITNAPEDDIAKVMAEMRTIMAAVQKQQEMLGNERLDPDWLIPVLAAAMAEARRMEAEERASQKGSTTREDRVTESAPPKPTRPGPKPAGSPRGITLDGVAESTTYIEGMDQRAKWVAEDYMRKGTRDPRILATILKQDQPELDDHQIIYCLEDVGFDNVIARTAVGWKNGPVAPPTPPRRRATNQQRATQPIVYDPTRPDVEPKVPSNQPRSTTSATKPAVTTQPAIKRRGLILRGFGAVWAFVKAVASVITFVVIVLGSVALMYYWSPKQDIHNEVGHYFGPGAQTWLDDHFTDGMDPWTYNAYQKLPDANSVAFQQLDADYTTIFTGSGRKCMEDSFYIDAKIPQGSYLIDIACTKPTLNPKPAPEVLKHEFATLFGYGGCFNRARLNATKIPEDHVAWKFLCKSDK